MQSRARHASQLPGLQVPHEQCPHSPIGSSGRARCRPMTRKFNSHPAHTIPGGCHTGFELWINQRSQTRAPTAHPPVAT